MADAVTGFSGVSATDPTKTSRGTTIVKSGSELDQNAFLKILTAELSNQDPTSTQDGTQYIAQMAQFSSLEQMTNLNSSIKLNNASSLIGKTVAVKDLDTQGNPYYGVVKSVNKNGDAISIDVVVGTTKDSTGASKDVDQIFSVDDVTDIV
jgi:flagellar basal-body rod modification protein FlgD